MTIRIGPADPVVADRDAERLALLRRPNLARPACECFTTFVSASATMKYGDDLARLHAEASPSAKSAVAARFP